MSKYYLMRFETGETIASYAGDKILWFYDLPSAFDSRKLKIKFSKGHDYMDSETELSHFSTLFFSTGILLAKNLKSSQLSYLKGQKCRVLSVHEGGKNHYHLVSPDNIVDALDFERSHIKRFEHSGRIKHIPKFALRKGVEISMDIFRLASDVGIASEIFVSEDFVSWYHDQKLTGLRFREVES